MSVDTQQALRLVACLTNPSAMQGARWESVDTQQTLRRVVCLTDPGAMQGARCGFRYEMRALAHFSAQENARHRTGV